MAEDLGIKKCWFHKNHYDIPKLRIEEIQKKCRVVNSRIIFNIIAFNYQSLGLWEEIRTANKQTYKPITKEDLEKLFNRK